MYKFCLQRINYAKLNQLRTEFSIVCEWKYSIKNKNQIICQFFISSSTFNCALRLIRDCWKISKVFEKFCINDCATYLPTYLSTRAHGIQTLWICFSVGNDGRRGKNRYSEVPHVWHFSNTVTLKYNLLEKSCFTCGYFPHAGSWNVHFTYVS